MSFVLGLTGSIGMGKSTTAEMFRAAGVPVHDADSAVHQLYQGAAAPLVEAAFPGTVINGVVDRALLGKRVIGQDIAMKKLEAIIHPLVRQSENEFRQKAAANRAPLIVLDVPLLLETAGEKRCDAVLVVTARPDIQRMRVLSRPMMTEERFLDLLSRQLPDAEKRKNAHFILDTSHGLLFARLEVQAILKALAGRPASRSIQDKMIHAA